MAFNFLGTMTKGELLSLKEFLDGEIEHTNDHINTLSAEIVGLEKTQAQLGDADTDKLMGGDALNEMKENVIKKAKRRYDDINPAIAVSQIKEPFIDNIKYKRERIEYKIKKITDTIEQKYKEKDLRIIAQTRTTELINTVLSLFTSENNKSLFKTEQEKIAAEKLTD